MPNLTLNSTLNSDATKGIDQNNVNNVNDLNTQATSTTFLYAYLTKLQKEMHLKAPYDVLGGISPEAFMQTYWQKKPLLIRGALKNYPTHGMLTQQELLSLAENYQLPSRFITQTPAKKWTVSHQIPNVLPKITRPWTTLVQKVNTVHPLIDQFMRLFKFIPYARLDDVMISYATDQAGIGAHVDTYDVFLFQGMGQRRWDIAKNYAPTLVKGAPLKLLADFEAEESYVLNAGDMLYLPPNYAHQGTAIGECMTYSIGFRAPKTDELIYEYLMENIAFIEQHKEKQAANNTNTNANECDDNPLYQDATQAAIEQPGKIPVGMVHFLDQALANMPKLSSSYLLGLYLTKPPHPQSEFNSDENSDENLNMGEVEDAPAHEEALLTPKAFAAVADYYLAYDAQMLYDDHHIYINGEAYTHEDLQTICALTITDIQLLNQFADERMLHNMAAVQDERASAISKPLKRLLYAWYQDAWILVND